jgi:hypothetical protein
MQVGTPQTTRHTPVSSAFRADASGLQCLDLLELAAVLCSVWE